MAQTSTTDSASIRLPSLISDSMVLQRDTRVRIWGEGRVGETIHVVLNDCRVKAKVGRNGRWQLYLEPMPAGGPYDMTIQDSTQTITIRNVCVGEVWIASGQSNMEFVIGHSWFALGVLNVEEEVASANYPLIRQFAVGRRVARKPQSDAPGSWKVCSPQAVGAFSAVGYFFARDLHKRLGVPVGIIHCAVGGMPAESYMSSASLKAEPEFRPILDAYSRSSRLYPSLVAKFEKGLQEWKVTSAKAEAQGDVVPAPPVFPADPRGYMPRPSGLYNTMIAPLTPYTIRGVIWYQGEANTSWAWRYRSLFRALIRDWRKAWRQGDFPFLFVQLANFAAPADMDWPALREAQTLALSLPNTAMAVTIDIGESLDVHPRNKQEVGRRLALAAHATVYGESIPCSGPIHDSMRVEGNRIRIRFQHVDGGLVGRAAKGTMRSNVALQTFAIAAKDGKFVPARAKIDGDSVVVTADEVPHPVAVRYAWSNDPVGCNLYNKAGLPASPFRTDDWPVAEIANPPIQAKGSWMPGVIPVGM